MTDQAAAQKCGWVSQYGNVCIKPAGHTGAHATRDRDTFTTTVEAAAAYERMYGRS